MKYCMRICRAHAQPIRTAASGAECVIRITQVCNPGNTADRQPQWALTFCYLSQSTANQNKVDSLPLLGLHPATFGTPALGFDHWAKFHPVERKILLK
jgi:hypothetical protein